VEFPRKGEPVTFTLHPEARAILHLMCPNHKAFGQYISRLLFEEERRQQEQRRLRAKLYEMVEEVLVS